MLPVLALCVLSAATVHDRLSEVNAEWKNVPAEGELLEPAHYGSERALLKDHLRRVEARLRAADASSLSIEQQQARARTLEHLHAYIASNECPLNETQATRMPVMIDSLGRHCPVAQLMAWDGLDPYVQEIARTANNIYVRDVHDAQFDAWVKSSGLTLDEVASIQPAYTPVTRWKVAQPIADAEVPTTDELHALPKEDDRGPDVANSLRELKQLRVAAGLPKGALRGLERNLTAPPIAFRGGVYIAIQIQRGDDYENTVYQLRRWSGATWERVAKFPVPINALAVHDGRLFVGGGGHPFEASAKHTNEHAFVESWDGETWTRLPMKARGQVQAFSTVRGQLCAAVTYFIPPS